MSGKFKFKLFTSADPKAQYDAVAEKDPFTFYLLANGIGYLGETKLFDATDDGIDLVQDINEDTVNETDIASAKAVVEYVSAKISAIDMLTTKFFRSVKSHTLTSDDIANENISVPDDAQEGDVGLLFTADTDDEDNNGESWYFISLMNYLSSVYTFTSGKTVVFTVDEDNNVIAEVKIADNETSLKTGDNGLYIDKVNAIDENTLTGKLVTDTAVVNYVKAALAGVVTYDVEDGTEG